MKTRDLEFELPSCLIAKHPARPRDAAKMLVLGTKNGQILESHFSNLGEFLLPSDVLVFNETKVFPARVFGNVLGRKREVVFLTEVKPKTWEVLIRGKVPGGERINFSDGFLGIVEKTEKGIFLKVNLSKKSVYEKLEKLGEMPLPPYLKRRADSNDKKDYQAIFAKKIGSAAAPTASLHFTNRLIKKLKDQGITIEKITLHVGLGTFAPVKTEILEQHPIHSEYFEIDPPTAKRLSMAKKEGRRIIAVGTTVVRALESSAKSSQVMPQKAETKLFIFPGYKFKFVDGLITNFHTPRSSLLALVYAFAGQKLINNAYQLAIKNKYRFYSYGDGMLIIKE